MWVVCQIKSIKFALCRDLGSCKWNSFLWVKLRLFIKIPLSIINLCTRAVNQKKFLLVWYPWFILRLCRFGVSVTNGDLFIKNLVIIKLLLKVFHGIKRSQFDNLYSGGITEIAVELKLRQKLNLLRFPLVTVMVVNCIIIIKSNIYNSKRFGHKINVGICITE